MGLFLRLIDSLTIARMPLGSEFDPDEYQMSIGDHLEELRRRILFGLAGILVLAVLCLVVGRSYLVPIFCRPLIMALQKYDISPQVYVDELADSFMVYIKVSMIVAAALASPWVVYQLWQFISAGLYPRERRYITKYIPLSITLLIVGMLFVYFLVLPWTLQFFIRFTADMPLPPLHYATSTLSPTTQPTFVQALIGDPAHPQEYQTWFNGSEGRLKMFAGGQIRVIPFGPSQLLATHFTLPDYLDLVMQLLLVFGLAFQLPLVVLALARIGIVEISQLKSFRRYAYFALVVIAAAISPGDVVTATVALLIPLVFLYELGIWLAVMAENASRAEEATRVP